MCRFIFSTILTLLAGIAIAAQTRPLLTEDVDTTPPGAINISVGADFFQNVKFPLSGLGGDLTRAGVIRIKTGYASNVEVQIEGSVQSYLAIDSQSPNPPISLNLNGNSTNDFDDIVTSVKVRLRNETKALPALAFKFGFQLPNSDQSRGIGTNQINTFTRIIAGKTFGKAKDKDPKLKIFGNIGLGLLSSPLESFSQNDVILYGLAGIYRVNDRVNLVSEVNGRLSTRNGAAPLGTESQSQFRFGTQIKASGLRFDTAAIFGLGKFSPDTGITFGVTYQSRKIFMPAR